MAAFWMALIQLLLRVIRFFASVGLIVAVLFLIGAICYECDKERFGTTKKPADLCKRSTGNEG